MRFFALALLGALTLSGCGGGTAKGLAKIQSHAQTQSGVGSGLRVGAAEALRMRDDFMLAQATGQLNASHDALSSVTFGDTTCTQSGNVYTCSFSNEYTFSCGGDTYAMKNGSITMEVKTSSPYLFKFGYSLDAKGGELGDEYKRLACTIDLSQFMELLITSPSAAQNITADEAKELMCSNFSCTYDDKTIDCDDLVEAGQVEAGQAEDGGCQ